MNNEQLIMREIIKAINDYQHIIFKPKVNVVRRVPMGTFSGLYPLHYLVGDIGRVHPSRQPSSKTTNSDCIYDHARTFGIRTRI